MCSNIKFSNQLAPKGLLHLPMKEFYLGFLYLSPISLLQAPAVIVRLLDRRSPEGSCTSFGKVFVLTLMVSLCSSQEDYPADCTPICFQKHQQAFALGSTSLQIAHLLFPEASAGRCSQEDFPVDCIPIVP